MSEEAAPPEVEVVRVGAGSAGDDGRLVVLELTVTHQGAPVRVGRWSAEVRLVDGTREELPVRTPCGPTEVRFPRGDTGTVTPDAVLERSLGERPVGAGEERRGVLVCDAGGLSADELLANGTTYTVRYGDEKGRGGAARHLVSSAPPDGPAPYFPGLGGT